MVESRSWKCECQFYEKCGLPCSHLLRLLIIKELPIISHINKRWIVPSAQPPVQSKNPKRGRERKSRRSWSNCSLSYLIFLLSKIENHYALGCSLGYVHGGCSNRSVIACKTIIKLSSPTKRWNMICWPGLKYSWLSPSAVIRWKIGSKDITFPSSSLGSDRLLMG